VCRLRMLELAMGWRVGVLQWLTPLDAGCPSEAPVPVRWASDHCGRPSETSTARSPQWLSAKGFTVGYTDIQRGFEAVLHVVERPPK
jgi:hypothetical protein